MKMEEKSDIKIKTESASIPVGEATVVCDNVDIDAEYTLQEVKVEPLDDHMMQEEINIPVVTNTDLLLEENSLETSMQPELSPQVEKISKRLDKETQVDRPFSCDQCNKQYKRETGLVLHKRQQHGTGLTGKLFQCNECDKSFVQNSFLVRHMLVHSGESPFQCQHCSKSFPQMYNLTRHVRGIHLKLRPFKCSKCGQTFQEKDNLTVHTRIHLKINVCHCVFCTQSFRNASALLIHMLRHIREFPYFCNRCDQTFDSKSALIKHRRRHLREPAYRCSHCTAGFNFRHHLNFHLRAKHNLKEVGRGTRHICPLCVKEFLRKNELDNHILRTIKEKPFDCSNCDKPFCNFSDLKIHTRTVHGNHSRP